jgi:hypothetical protein
MHWFLSYINEANTNQASSEFLPAFFKKTSHEATVLLYSPGIDPFLEDLAESVDRVFYFEEGPRDITEADCQDVAENDGSEDAKGVLMIWSRKQLVRPRMAHDVVNPRMLELEVAKEILAELFDVRTHEVDVMIRQRLDERTLYS